MAALHELKLESSTLLTHIRSDPEDLLHVICQNTSDQFHKEVNKGEQDVHPEIQKYVKCITCRMLLLGSIMMTRCMRGILPTKQRWTILTVRHLVEL